jgi:hypothetical protein
MINLKNVQNKYISLTILLGFSTMIMLLRLHTYNEPIDRDLATYAVIGHEMLKGRALYSDLWDQKPPAIHITFSIAEKLVGYGQGEFYFLGVVAAILTLIGIYRAGSVGGLGLAGGFWAAAIWACISSDMLLQANQPNVEAFINTVLVWVFALLLFPKPKVSHVNMAGILLAVGSLYKPQIAVFAVLYSAASFFFPENKNRFSNTFKISLRLIIPILLAWLGCYSYFYLTHRSNDFYNTIFTFNRFYGGHLRLNLKKGFSSEKFFPVFIQFLAPVVLLILVGFFLSFRQLAKPWFFLLAYISGAYFSVALPGKFFPHYYQYWLPVISIGGGWGVVVIGKSLKTFTKSFYLIPGILCLISLFFYEAPNYLLSADNWSIEKFGSIFVKDKQLADMLARNLKPSQSFVMLGNEPSVYFYSRKSPPTGMVFIYPTVEGPLAPYLLKRLLNDITTQKPDVLIFCNSDYTQDMKPLMYRYHSLKNYPQERDFKIYAAGNINLDK